MELALQEPSPSRAVTCDHHVPQQFFSGGACECQKLEVGSAKQTSRSGSQPCGGGRRRLPRPYGVGLLFWDTSIYLAT